MKAIMSTIVLNVFKLFLTVVVYIILYASVYI